MSDLLININDMVECIKTTFMKEDDDLLWNKYCIVVLMILKKEKETRDNNETLVRFTKEETAMIKSAYDFIKERYTE